jgi:hypothetical protein
MDNLNDRRYKSRELLFPRSETSGKIVLCLKVAPVLN